MTRPLIVEFLGSFGASRQLALTRLKALEDRYRRVIEQHGADSPQAQRLKRRVDSDRRVAKALEPRVRRMQERIRSATEREGHREPPPVEAPRAVSEGELAQDPSASEVAMRVQALMAGLDPRQVFGLDVAAAPAAARRGGSKAEAGTPDAPSVVEASADSEEAPAKRKPAKRAPKK